MLTLADLGVLHGVEVTPDGTVVARLTPTYSGCPAVAEIRAEVATRLRAAGSADVRVVTVLEPPWTTDRITDEGRRELAEHGVAPPGPRRAPGPAAGRTWLSLTTTSTDVPCPLCASVDTEEISHFAATACTALPRCRTCLEPFPHVKDLPRPFPPPRPPFGPATVRRSTRCAWPPWNRCAPMPRPSPWRSPTAWPTSSRSGRVGASPCAARSTVATSGARTRPAHRPVGRRASASRGTGRVVLFIDRVRPCGAAGSACVSGWCAER